MVIGSWKVYKSRGRRDAAIVKMRRAGRTLEWIGDYVGLSRERVRQIYVKGTR